ncbi:MAG: DUF885 domain-containing protein [Ignavibacteriae bacterium]|nr:DUF885 domain-containing protein [Ignavibacteria bacterium]MBI3363516.1 DUF885 domain-containing protein [Ignavibacteriota bacterium]
MKLSTVFLTIVAAALFALSVSAQTEDEKFDKLSQDFLKGYFIGNPITATGIGVHDYDSLLDDVSPTAVEIEVKRLNLSKQQLGEINTKALSKQKNIDYRMLDENINEALFGYQELKDYEWNPLVYTGAIGNSIASLIYQEFAPLDQRLNNAIARTKQVPRFLDQAKANLKTASKLHVGTAIKQNKGNISMFTEELPNAAKTASPEIQAEIKTAAAEAIAALNDFGTWLEKDLLPRANQDTRIGKDLYYKKLSHALKSSLAPEQVLQRAESEKARVQDEMYKLAAPLYREYYNEDAEGKEKLVVIKKVLDKIVLDHPKKEEVMDVIKKIIPDLEQFIVQHDLLTLDPTQPLVVREMPEYERGVAVAFMESPGPLEKNMKSFYDVLPIPNEWTPEQVESFLREYNNWSLKDLSIHEGVPGHYVQGYYSNRYPSIIRSVFGSGSMVEGWAVYAERMMVEQGYQNNDARMKLINLKWYIRVVINAILDQKIHAGDMTEQQAMDLMTKEGFQEEREAAGKWRRANLTSAQLSTYFVGFQEIWDLREAYKQKMGDKFSLKEFHEKFMSFGSPPVKYIRESMLGD